MKKIFNAKRVVSLKDRININALLISFIMYGFIQAGNCFVKNNPTLQLARYLENTIRAGIASKRDHDLCKDIEIDSAFNRAVVVQHLEQGAIIAAALQAALKKKGFTLVKAKVIDQFRTCILRGSLKMHAKRVDSDEQI